MQAMQRKMLVERLAEVRSRVIASIRKGDTTEEPRLTLDERLDLLKNGERGKDWVVTLPSADDICYSSRSLGDSLSRDFFFSLCERSPSLPEVIPKKVNLKGEKDDGATPFTERLHQVPRANA